MSETLNPIPSNATNPASNSTGLKNTLTQPAKPQYKVVATANSSSDGKTVVVMIPADLHIDPANPEILEPASVVEQKIFGWLEHGLRTATNAIVLHMTGGAASGTLGQYSKEFVNGKRTNGAHFLIDRAGKIYQTAKINYRTNHVGNVRPRGFMPNGLGNKEDKTLLTPEEKLILHPKEETDFETILSKLTIEQLKKPYGSDIKDNTTRYPSNGDAIGIEFESTHDEKTKPKTQKNTIYQDLTESQIKSGKLLIKFLKEKYKNITNADIYEHPDVSYKVRSEAHGSKEGLNE